MELARILSCVEEDRDRPWYQGLSGLAGLMAEGGLFLPYRSCLSFRALRPNITYFVRIPGRWVFGGL